MPNYKVLTHLTSSGLNIRFVDIPVFGKGENLTFSFSTETAQRAIELSTEYTKNLFANIFKKCELSEDDKIVEIWKVKDSFQHLFPVNDEHTDSRIKSISDGLTLNPSDIATSVCIYFIGKTIYHILLIKNFTEIKNG